MDPASLYKTETKPQRLFIKRFGGLVKHLLPFSLDPDGFILKTVNKYYAIADCVETYTASGALLDYGILLNNQFMGTYYNNRTQLLGDFGSYVFVTTKIAS